MAKLKILSLHCFGSNPAKHAGQRHHFVHCAEATSALADYLYPAAPHRLEPQVVRDLLKNGMGCSDEEVDAFGFEEPRCWFRFTDNGYEGLEASVAYLGEICRRERPDGIAGYSNGGGIAQLVAAAREGGQDDFQSNRFLMSFAGATSPTMQRHIRDLIGPAKDRISIPALIFGSARDPMLANARQMASDIYENCTLAVVDEDRPFANHALPDNEAAYEPIVAFLKSQV